MSVARAPEQSLRLERSEFSRLLWAFGISLAAHLLFYGVYHVGDKQGWWRNLHMPAWMQEARLLNELFKRNDSTAKKTDEHIPLVFVEVTPAQATLEPPKDAQFYSSQNSKAANPDMEEDTGSPKITGRQRDVPKVEDVEKPVFTPLQPVFPAPLAKAEPEQEIKAVPMEQPGDLTMGQPDTQPRKDTGDAKLPKPRTIKEAMNRLQNSRIPGEKMQQEGGVKRRLEIASFDAQATPFGAYDAAIVEAISQRWFTLLDEREYASESRGKVVIQFVLHYDGHISGLEVASNSAGEVLGLVCQKAVREPAPYPQWPADMRRLMGDKRFIQFTFYYN